MSGVISNVNRFSQSLRTEPTKEARRSVEVTFETLLDRIDAEDRDLNDWESKCLRVALIMMADDDYESAAAAMEACQHHPQHCSGPSRDLMIRDMRALYGLLKGWPAKDCPGEHKAGT